MDRDAREDIASLRLVNKALHRLATPILFRYFNACFPTHDLITPDDWAARLLGISQSPVIEEVQRLNIGFETSISYRGLERCLFEAAFVLPALVHACNKLTALRIDGSSASKSDVEIMDHEVNQNLFMKTVEHVLRRIIPNAGSYSLQTLEMTLPLTHEFAKLADISIGRSPKPYRQPLLYFMKDLKHLHLAVSDNSGSGGQRYYSSVETKRHRKHPNTSYAASFFNIAMLPDRLHSLSISATHILDMDMLGICNLRNLRELQLNSVKISQEFLADISSRNLSTLKSVELDQVELKSGTWESMLLEFCVLPHLERFWISSCGYARDGTSQDLAPGLWPPMDDPEVIETLNYRDKYALGSLQRHVNQVRTLAGCETFTEYDYRFAELPCLETLDLE
ncbi:MAG: hypothetical protein Q9217_006882 [Psora testacea]